MPLLPDGAVQWHAIRIVVRYGSLGMYTIHISLHNPHLPWLAVGITIEGIPRGVSAENHRFAVLKAAWQ
jgi:hypothetical protein